MEWHRDTAETRPRRLGARAEGVKERRQGGLQRGKSRGSGRGALTSASCPYPQPAPGQLALSATPLPGSGAEPHTQVSRAAEKDEGREKMFPCGPGSPSIPVPWAAALLLALGVERALAIPEICIQCPGSVQNLSKVALYCKQTPELMLHARCCLNQKGTILGLDLQNCSLKDLGLNFPQAHTAIIIDLQANPLKHDLSDTFHGFTQLQTLILPQDVNCPGGINAWNTVTLYTNNQTCLGQRNLCNSTRDAEICPENGSCVPDGPGLLLCVCADGFHGYKCMRQGSFPLLMFFGILGSTTLSISILLWGTQRRKAKAS